MRSENTMFVQCVHARMQLSQTVAQYCISVVLLQTLFVLRLQADACAKGY
jgi:hypothetical protein